MFKYQRGNNAVMNSDINTLVFDLGDTLYPSSLQIQAMNEALQLHDIANVNYSNLYNKICAGFPFLGGTLDMVFISTLLENIGPPSDVDAITLLADYRHVLYILIKKYILADPNDTWKYLKDLSSNYCMGILSDNSIDTKEFWQEILMETDNDFFDFFIVSEEAGVRKPSLQMFHSIKQKVDHETEFRNIIFFGDHLIRDGASALYGMTFIHINGFTEPPTQTRHSLLPNEKLISIDFINYDTLGLLYLTHTHFTIDHSILGKSQTI